MRQLLLSQARLALEGEDLSALTPPPFTAATGVSAAPFIGQVLDLCRAQCPALRGAVRPIVNRFFGETITVSGLVTGGDLMDQLRGLDLGERLLIPSSMLRAGEQVFLDDVTLAQVEETLGVPVRVVDAESGFDLVDAMLGMAAPPPDAVQRREETEYYQYNPGAK